MVTSTSSMHNPAVVAGRALNVDGVSGGRLELAIGAGGAEQAGAVHSSQPAMPHRTLVDDGVE